VLAVAMSLWLRRFSQGPLEWLVGRWTKGPLRKEERDRTALNA
jgi:uncharacterized membrane protein YeiB